MKKLFLMMAVALAMVSCSNDDFDSGVSMADSAVEFTLSFDGATGTRAISDGLSADIVYAVAFLDGQYVADTSSPVSERKATVNFVLAKGQTYDFAFWAQDSDCKSYLFDKEKATITIDYDVPANDESRDAFFAYRTFHIEGEATHEVTLKRPFAQLNLGDMYYDKSTAAGITVPASTVTVSEVATTLNLLDGTIGGIQNDVTFEVADRPADEKLVVKETNYEWLSMNYLLVADETTGEFSSTANVTFTLKTNSKDITLTSDNTPLRRNWRTNILTSLVSNQTFNIIIDQKFEGDLEVDDVFTKVAEGVKYDKITKTFVLEGAEGLTWFAEQSNAETKHELITNNFEGQNVTLTSDVDMTGKAWTPIGDTFANSFKGTFDGGNHTISYLTVNDADVAGLFGNVNGTIKDVKLANVKVTGNFKAGALVASAYGLIENCHVDGGSVTSTPRVVNGANDDANNVGGLVGYLAEGANNIVRNCSAMNMTVTAYRDLGGLVGTAQKGSSVLDSKVENIDVIANQMVEYVAVKSANAGEVVGRNLGSTVTGNTVTDVTVNVLEIDENGTVEVGNGALAAIATLDNENVETVVFTEDIEGKAEANSGYGVTGITHKNGATIDGGGQTLTVTGNVNNTNWGSAIHTKGGVIKNLTIEGGFRGIFVAYETEKVVIDNVTVNPVAYPISVDGANGHGMEVKNSTLNGWASWSAAIGDVTFTNCSFGSNGSYAYMRPYGKTLLTDCTFSEGYELDATQKTADITLVNCKVGETVITAENITTLLGADAANAKVQ